VASTIRVARARRLDFDHLGAEIRHHRRRRPAMKLAQSMTLSPSKMRSLTWDSFLVIYNEAVRR
jgi:hypothetical protein